MVHRYCPGGPDLDLAVSQGHAHRYHHTAEVSMEESIHGSARTTPDSNYPSAHIDRCNVHFRVFCIPNRRSPYDGVWVAAIDCKTGDCNGDWLLCRETCHEARELDA